MEAYIKSFINTIGKAYSLPKYKSFNYNKIVENVKLLFQKTLQIDQINQIKKITV